MLALAALVAAQAAFAAPTPNVAVELSRIELLAFSDDGATALAKETTSGGLTTTQTLLLLSKNGVDERLPVSRRVAGELHDLIDDEVCTATATRISDLAIDLRGVTVAIGMCSQPGRPIVDVMGKLKPQVVSKRIGKLHSRVGFAGRTFLPPTGPLVVVIGVDEDGNDRVGVTTQER